MTYKKTKKTYLILLVILGLVLIFIVVFNKGRLIKEVRIEEKNNNLLKVMITVKFKSASVKNIQFWDVMRPYDKSSVSPYYKGEGICKYLLMPLDFGKTYNFRIIYKRNNAIDTTKIFDFKTKGQPVWFEGIVKVNKSDSNKLPIGFKNGLILLNGRDVPGMVYMVDYTGSVKWYHRFSKTGVKVVKLTPENTLLSILGTSQFKTSYGNQIVEIDLAGDTMLNLHSGVGDFNNIIVHHDLIKTNDGNIAVLVSENKTFDLSKAGGKLIDTLNVDGINIYDKNGSLKWKWDVSNVLDPIKDKNIVAKKNDWMHANSIAIDNDGNFLISFYNIQQIWKIDRNTGRLLLKIGKDGSFSMSDSVVFDNAHDIQINRDNELTLFDNGIMHRKSRIVQYKLTKNEDSLKSYILINLPPNLHNERMGSAYQISSSDFLFCSSKKNAIGLINLNNQINWYMETTFNPYRAIFMPCYQKIFDTFNITNDYVAK
ncbi:MAG: aryl-sulfate sulfotransferase [Chitinophagaceae bacterium]